MNCIRAFRSKLSLRKRLGRCYVAPVDTLETVFETIERHRLLERGDAVLVGLSGGPDSVALLHLLRRLRERYRLRLGAVYINHRIRPRAARDEEKFCRRLCDKLGVDLTIVREDIPARARRERKGLEETARDFRYETFAKIADSNKCHRIALAHHADDRVETVLFRIIRGTGLTGLAGMPVKRGRIIRPLYDLTKQEILAYLKKHRLTWCEDRTNSGPDFSRNFIRNRLLPVIRKRLNPAVDQAILNLSETTAEEVEVLESVVSKVMTRAITITPGGKIQVDLTVASRSDKWLRRRLLRACFTLIGKDMPDREVIDRLDRMMLSGGKALSLPHKLRALLVGDKIVIFRPVAPWPPLPVHVGQTSVLGIPGMSIRARATSAHGSAVQKRRQARKVALDWHKVLPPLEVRPIRVGDRFQPLGLKGTKKVGDFLTDRKLPSIYRDEVPVVCDSLGIIWLAGFEIAERVKRDSKTKEVLILEITCNQKDPRKAI